MNAVVLFTVEVFGVLLRVLECQGKRWLCSEDIALVFEYRSRQSITSIARRHKRNLEGCLINARIDGAGANMRLFNESGLRYLCDYSPRPGALHLLHWLDAGGLQAECDDVISFDGEPVKSVGADAFESKPKSEIDFVFEPRPKNILAFKKPKSAGACAFGSKGKSASAGAFDTEDKYVVTDVFDSPSANSPSKSDQPAKAVADAKQAEKQLRREIDYCRDMAKTLLRYCNADEVENVRSALNEQANQIMLSRYTPGLNAALYDLYRRHRLEGGKV